MRTTRFWVIAAAAAGWLIAAALLWRTSTPALELVEVPPTEEFADAFLARAAHYERGLWAIWAAATLTQLVVLVLAVLSASRLRLRGIRAGVTLGAATLVAVWVAALPWTVTAHWWRRRYGVSDAGYATILVDPWLERIGALGAATVAIALFMVLARRLGGRWWLVGGPAFALVAAAFLLLQPLLFAPRNEPLRDPDVTRPLRELARQHGIEDISVELRDASRRTNALNAEFYGVGPTKRIVIWDTAYRQLDPTQISMLVAHELGHVKRNHVWKGLGWLFLFALPGSWFVARATRSRGGLGEPRAVPTALLALTVVQLALLPVESAISRRYEREADWFALQATADPDTFENLAGRLAMASHSDPDPPRWARVLLRTHPTAMERIRVARTLAAEAPREGS